MKIAKGALGQISDSLGTLLKEVRMPMERACEVAEGLISLQSENDKFVLVAQPMLNGRAFFGPEDDDFEELNKLWTMEVEIDFPVLDIDMLKKAGGEIDPITLVALINNGFISSNGTK